MNNVPSLLQPREDRAATRYVELEVTSNYGHPEYTCVYRIRVHGNMAAAPKRN